MRIAYVTMQFPAPRETFAIRDVQALEHHGATVEVHCMREERSEAPELVEEWGLAHMRIEQTTAATVCGGLVRALLRPDLSLPLVATVIADNLKHPVHLLKGLAMVPRALSVHRRIERDPPDVVHLFWGHYPSLAGLLLRRRSPGVPLTMFLGAYDLVMRFPTSARLARRADRVFTHARANLPLLEQAGIAPERVTVVHRGMRLDTLSPPRAGKVPGRIVSAGGFDADKGFHEVIAAFATVQAERPDASLVLLGDGPERAALEADVAARGLANVSFPGFVPNERVLEEMAAAEVLLFLSRREAERLPNVVKEAMALGCACVVSDSPGIDELVTDGTHGFVVGARDVAGAAERVGRLLDDPALRASLAGAAEAHLRAGFDVRETMRRYLDVWRELAGAVVDAARPGGSNSASPVVRRSP